MRYTVMRRWVVAPCLAFTLMTPGILPAHSSSLQSIAEQSRLSAPSGGIVLVVDGAIQHQNAGDEAHFDLEILQSLPAQSLRTTTAVTDGVRQFDGVLMRDLLDLVGAQGQTVEALALNHYRVDIPIEDFHDYDVILATHMDGERLLPSDKGPLWIVYPRDDWRQLQDIRYDYRWVWQLQRLTVK